MKRVAGFTLIEILVVIFIMAITLTMVGASFNSYLTRTSAKRAAQMFGQDLTLARNTAARSRQTVVLDFNEGSREYLIRVAAGDTLLYRLFGADSETTLSSMDLQVTGDTVAFNSQGIADLSGAASSLGRAVFSAGNSTYAVSFNSMGSSRIEEG